jgi:diguanylate cyclase (GGDEF)-like protein
VNTDDSKPVVLLIDDSVDVHRLLRARLRHEHIQLHAVASGVEAMAAMQTMSPATILLDLDMPEQDGFSLLRQLKDTAGTHNIPVIILSGLQGSDDKVTAFDLGAADYVTKPFDMAELRARLRATLRLHHLLALLADRADLDGLTGLGNRSHFNKRWAEKVAEAQRYNRPLTLAILDVDHFKRVNDTFGHPAGDEVLLGMATLLQHELRRPDVACRYGGEEFALILPSTGPEDAGVLGERIRQELSQRVWPRHPESPVTVSIGIAGTHGSCAGITMEQWIEAADRNLYTAKRNGRDRIVVTSVDTPPQLAKAG